MTFTALAGFQHLFVCTTYLAVVVFVCCYMYCVCCLVHWQGTVVSEARLAVAYLQARGCHGFQVTNSISPGMVAGVVCV